MPARWAVFAGLTGVVLTVLVALARLSQSVVTESESDSDSHAPGQSGPADHRDRPLDTTPDHRADPAEGRDDAAEGRDDATGGPPAVREATTPLGEPTGERASVGAVRGRQDREGDAPDDELPRRQIATRDPTSTALLVNVALSQAFLGTILAFGAWYSRVPLSSIGLDAAAFGPTAIAAGIALGVALYATNEVGAAVADRAGVAASEALREMLAPESTGGWLLLLVVVLPVIAVFEELLFRGALVGALAVGFGLSPWLLAVLSSVVFGIAHGAQGPGGVLVTGALGFALAAAFVLTGSLVAVVVAHYLVNALEFVVHEGLGIEPFGRVNG